MPLTYSPLNNSVILFFNEKKDRLKINLMPMLVMIDYSFRNADLLILL